MRRLSTRAASLPAAAGRTKTLFSTPRSSLLASSAGMAPPRKPVETAAMALRRLHSTAQHLQAAPGLDTTATSFPTTHDKIQEVGNSPYFVNNQFVQSSTTQFIDLHDPTTNNLITRVPQNTDEELKAAVASASKAFETWRNTSVLHRQQIMFKFVALIRENWDRLAASITLEQGKTFADAKGDVLRGLQVAEAACGASELLKGEVLEVAKDMETRTYREPLGVVAAICPFSTLVPIRRVLNL